MNEAMPRRAPVFVLVAALVGALALVSAPAAHADAVRDKQWYLGPLGIEQAWAKTKGAGVKIGILDSGVDGTATDLKGAVVAGRDFSGAGAPNGQTPVKGDPHGTQVASLAAARGHGGSSGVIGSAPAASVVSASIDDSETTGDSFGTAIRWLVDQGASVINASIFTTGDQAVASLRSAIRYAQSKDVVVVAATGDVFKGSLQLEAPADIPGVVAVTGVDKNLKRDPSATIGHGTAIAAPFSTTTVHPFSSAGYVGLPVANPRSDSDGPYGSSAGTSLSAPIVAGIVALIRAAHPDLDAANVINRLLKTATPAGGSTPNPVYGYGIVNAAKAVTADVSMVSTNPLGGASGNPTSHPSGGTPSGSTGAPAPSSTAPTTVPSTAPATATSDTSSGLGTGGWVAIVVAIVIVLGLIVWFSLRRNRTPGPTAPPSAPPPR